MLAEPLRKHYTTLSVRDRDEAAPEAFAQRVARAQADDRSGADDGHDEVRSVDGRRWTSLANGTFTHLR